MKEVSVLIVTCQRAAQLKRLLESIVAFSDPRVVEVKVLVNGRDEESESLLKEFARVHPNFNYLISPRINRGEARNFLIAGVQGKVIYFLDDDVMLQSDVFGLIVDKFREYPHVSILSGPNLNMPGSSIFQKSQGCVLGSFFGSLWVSLRYKRLPYDKQADETGLILCNLALKKEIFSRSGARFSSGLVSAEENLLLSYLKDRGYRAMYIPGLAIYHERRGTYRGFCRQIFTYGMGRAQVFKAAPAYIKTAHFLPTIFLIYLVSVPFVALPGYRFLLVVYLALDVLCSINLSWANRDFRLLPFLLVVYPTVHLSYGWGFLNGMLTKAKGRYEGVFEENGCGDQAKGRLCA